MAEVLDSLRRGGAAVRARATLDGGGQGTRLVGLAQLVLGGLRVEELRRSPSLTGASSGCASAVSGVALASRVRHCPVVAGSIGVLFILGGGVREQMCRQRAKIYA